MKRFCYCGAGVVLVSTCLVLLLVQDVAAEEPTFRALTRKYFSTGDGKALAKLVGFETPPQKVIALKYKVLLFTRDASGKAAEKPIDPKEHRFKIGDQVRVVVEPYGDYYIYIFHIGPDGEHGFLLPAEGEDPPLAKAAATVTLPGDGFFEFSPPPGKEQVFVVATEKPVANRQLLADVLAKKPGEKLTQEEIELQKTLKATRKALLMSVQEQTKQLLNKTVMWRGIARGSAREKLISDIRTRGVKEGTFEEPGMTAEGGTSAVYLSTVPTTKAKLVVSIPLESTKE